MQKSTAHIVSIGRSRKTAGIVCRAAERVGTPSGHEAFVRAAELSGHKPSVLCAASGRLMKSGITIQILGSNKELERSLKPVTLNPTLNLAPFGRWTLRDKAAQRRLASRWTS